MDIFFRESSDELTFENFYQRVPRFKNDGGEHKDEECLRVERDQIGEGLSRKCED